MGLEFGVDAAPHAANAATERLHATDSGDCDQRSEQAIFDCRRAALIRAKLVQKSSDSVQATLLWSTSTRLVYRALG
jgi:hypothetical protein